MPSAPVPGSRTETINEVVGEPQTMAEVLLFNLNSYFRTIKPYPYSMLTPWLLHGYSMVTLSKAMTSLC